MKKFPKNSALFGFGVGFLPSLFGIYIDSLEWWFIVIVLYLIGMYIDHNYFDSNDDMFEKRKK
jgi:uncharacterized membrane protein